MTKPTPKPARPGPILWRKSSQTGASNPLPPLPGEPTPAARSIAVVEAMPGVVVLEPASQSAQEMFDIGYRPLFVPIAGNGYVHLCFHATTPDVIEVQSVSAHPAKQGH